MIPQISLQVVQDQDQTKRASTGQASASRRRGKTDLVTWTSSHSGQTAWPVIDAPSNAGASSGSANQSTTSNRAGLQTGISTVAMLSPLRRRRLKKANKDLEAVRKEERQKRYSKRLLPPSASPELCTVPEAGAALGHRSAAEKAVLPCMCGNNIFASAKFCPKCGQSHRQLVCVCGESLASEAQLCPKCGTQRAAPRPKDRGSAVIMPRSSAFRSAADGGMRISPRISAMASKGLRPSMFDGAGGMMGTGVVRMRDSIRYSELDLDPDDPRSSRLVAEVGTEATTGGTKQQKRKALTIFHADFISKQAREELLKELLIEGSEESDEESSGDSEVDSTTCSNYGLFKLSHSLNASELPPKQLPSTLLSMLLLDLVQFNGRTYEAVLPELFSDKHVALYFAKAHDARCQEFLPVLQRYSGRSVNTLAVILVCCDNCDDSFVEHTHMVRVPTYPRGDYRVPVLRNLFDVRECPYLVIMDPKGLVLTHRGIEKISTQCFKFPPVDSPWNERYRNRADLVLHELGLPPCEGRRHNQFTVVALLFGEPWCPETRNVARRLLFLLQEVKRRREQQDLECKDLCAAYFVHTEGLGLYRVFPDSNISFPSLCISKGQMSHLLHYFEEASTPALCLVSPEVGWAVHDGRGWLQRDPTGICFPWLPQAVVIPDERARTMDDFSQPFYDIIKELREDTINDSLNAGPVFVALLHGVSSSQRADAFNVFRAVATAYAARAAERRQSESGLFKDYCGNIDDCNAAFQHLQESTSSPSRCAQLPEAAVFTGQPVASQLLVDMQAQAGRPRASPSKLSFYYVSAETCSLHLLSKFCCHDTRLLNQHDLWEAQQARQDGEFMKTQKELQERYQHLSEASKKGAAIDAESAKKANTPKQERATQEQDQCRRGQTLMSEIVEAMSSLSGLGVQGSEYEDSEGEAPAKQAAATAKAGCHFPRMRYTSPNELTERLLGEGHRNNGTALIIDLSKGCYYVCGALLKDALCEFIDGWHDGTLEPFDIALTNQYELVSDYENFVARQLKSRPEGVPRLLSDHRPRIMPCIVIWLPSQQHARTSLSFGPAGLHRSFLNYAFRQAPRQNTQVANNASVAMKDVDEIFGLCGKSMTRLVPVIEKFWIFALADTDEAFEERMEGLAGLTWEPAGESFLKDLQRLFNHLMRKASKSSDVKRPAHTTTTGLTALRHVDGSNSRAQGNANICFRTEKTRRALHGALVDELTYHLLVQCPPPPLFVLFVGELAEPQLLPWPEALASAHLHVLGKVHNLRAFQDQIAPTTTVSDWDEWTRTAADDLISASVARHITVPWTLQS